MTKASAQKTLQDFYFLLFTFVSGFFYFCFYLVSITFALVMTIIFLGIPLLVWVLQTTHTFVQYERIQTKVYTDVSIELFEPRKKRREINGLKREIQSLIIATGELFFGSCRNFLSE